MIGCRGWLGRTSTCGVERRQKSWGGPTGENHREVAVETLTEKDSQPKRVGK